MKETLFAGKHPVSGYVDDVKRRFQVVSQLLEYWSRNEPRPTSEGRQKRYNHKRVSDDDSKENLYVISSDSGDELDSDEEQSE
jgi:hypothetical protein